MSQLAASSTVVNLLLATGPFTFPYSFVGLGPYLSSLILAITCFLAYISATYMIEIVSLAASAKPGRKSEKKRHDSLFHEACYATPQQQRRTNDKDTEHKESQFYIREKLEIGIIAERIAAPWVRTAIICVLVVYMYGAMALKYTSGAESLYRGISFLFTDDPYYAENNFYNTAYYLSIFVFGFFSVIFSFGDIENSKVLQIITSIARVVVLIMMYAGTLYYWGTDGLMHAPAWNWAEQSKSLATVFGNVVFVFIYHHSIPGIIYPVRPQAGMGKMFLIANVCATILLWLEGMLAFLVFSGYPTACGNAEGETFPCKVSDLFTENFQDIPVLGQIVQFYPMLNVSAVPILVITLRNNFMQVVPVKRWLREAGCCAWLLEDHKRSVKGAWSFIFSIPAIVLVIFVREPQVLVTYTGGICGTFILFLIPVTVISYARKRGFGKGQENFNASPFQSVLWSVLILAFSAITLTFVMLSIINGTAGE